MPTLAVVFGLMLVVVGIAGYAYGQRDGTASMTALIPGAFGAVILLCGLLALMKDSLRKHLMHVAAAVSLIGFIIPTARLMMRVGQISMTPAVISQLATAIICLFFLLAAIGSFASARRS